MTQLRNTKQRMIVLEAVREHNDHPTADEIYLDVSSVDPKISRGTVYRNLNILAETGRILRVEIHGADRFDHRTQPHYHMYCSSCGKVTDAPVQYHKGQDLKMEKETGYEAITHSMVFQGFCSDCIENSD